MNARFSTSWITGLVVGAGYFFCLLTGNAHAKRTSADYEIQAETNEGSGERATSADYIKESIEGSMVVSSTGDSAAYRLTLGYAAQLYDIVALNITAPPSTSLSETASRQLAAAPLLDDDSTLDDFDPATVAWSIVSGPIASISTGGLATAGNVYQSTPAVVGADVQDANGQLTLTVLNTGDDDYESYGGDYIYDWWQVQYFGQPPNGSAGPNANPDGDSLTNLLEFAFGTNPTTNQGYVSYVGNMITPGSPTTIVSNTEFGVDYRAMYSRRKDYVSAGLTYTAEFSADLNTYVASTDTPTIVADDGVYQVVTVPYRLFINGRKARFFHVVVQTP
jgi:hypothetical protein